MPMRGPVRDTLDIRSYLHNSGPPLVPNKVLVQLPRQLLDRVPLLTEEDLSIVERRVEAVSAASPPFGNEPIEIGYPGGRAYYPGAENDDRTFSITFVEDAYGHVESLMAAWHSMVWNIFTGEQFYADYHPPEGDPLWLDVIVRQLDSMNNVMRTVVYVAVFPLSKDVGEGNVTSRGDALRLTYTFQYNTRRLYFPTIGPKEGGNSWWS